MSVVTVLLTVIALLAPTGLARGASLGVDACTSLLQDGGFEQGGQPWTTSSSGGYDIVSPFMTHSGAQAAYLAGYNNAVDQVAQTVQLPAGQTITLQVWWYMSTTEVSHSWDSLAISAESAGVASQTLLRVDDGAPADGWHVAEVDLSGYAGKQMRLVIVASSDDSNATSFFVDDVEITACPAGAGGGLDEHRYLPFIGRAGA